MKNGKNKGNKYERDIAKLLTEAWGIKFRRVPTSGGMEHWRGDIVAVFDEDRIRFPFCIELKNQKTLNIPAWIRQTQAEAEETNKIGLLIFHRNHTSKNYLIMKESEFKDLYADQYDTIIIEKQQNNISAMNWIKAAEKKTDSFIIKFNHEQTSYVLLPFKDFISFKHSFQ